MINKCIRLTKNLGIIIFLTFSQISLYSCDKTEKVEATTTETKVTQIKKDETPQKEKKAGLIEIEAKDLAGLDLSIYIVSKKNLPTYLKTPGEIAEDESLTTHVTPKLSGRVININKNIGNYVIKGDTLAVIESQEIAKLQSDLLEINGKIFYLEKSLLNKNQLLKASLSQQDKYIDFLNQTYQRQKKLFEDNIAPRKNVEEADKNLKTAILERDKINLESENQKQQVSSEINSLQLQSQSITKQLNLLNFSDNQIKQIIATKKLNTSIPIYSPMNGLISQKHISLGEMISTDKEIFTIIDPSSVWLYANIYENDINKIRIGQTAYFLPRGYPQESKFNAIVDYILPQVNEQNRTAKVRLKIVDKPRDIKSGTFADVFINIGQGLSVLAVPKSAIQRAKNKEVVYLKNNDSEYQITNVVTGISQNNFIEIKSGLKQGDRVVTKGSFTLKALSMKDQIGEEE